MRYVVIYTDDGGTTWHFDGDFPQTEAALKELHKRVDREKERHYEMHPLNVHLLMALMEKYHAVLD